MHRKMSRTRTPLLSFVVVGLVCLAVVVAQPSVASPEPEKPIQIRLGAFCIANLPSSLMKASRVGKEADGEWWLNEIEIPAGNGIEPAPRLYFFDSPGNSDSFVPCGSEEDRQTVLEGDINYGKIRARQFQPYGNRSARFEVDPLGIDVGLGRVHSSVQPIFGASVDFAKRLLLIKNQKKMSVIPDRGTYDAVFQVEATDLQFIDARVRLGEEESAVVTTRLRNRSVVEGRLTFILDVTQGDLVLADGKLVSDPIRGDGFPWIAGGLVMETSSFVAEGMTLEAIGGILTAEMSTLAIEVERLEHGAPLRASLVPTAPITSRWLRAAGSQSPEELALGDYSWQGLHAQADSVSITDEGGTEQIGGAGDLELAALDDRSVEGELTLRQPAIAIVKKLGLLLEPPTLELEFSGLKERLAFKGRLDTNNLLLGALRVEDEQAHSVEFSAADAGQSVFDIDFEFDLKPTAGKLSLVDPGDLARSASLETDLELFRAKGALQVGGGDGLPRLEIVAGSLWGSFAAATTAQEALFGSPVKMLGASARLEISRPLVVGPSGVRGYLDILTAGVILVDGKIDLSDAGGRPFTFETSLETTVDSVLGLNLANGKYSLREAHFDLSGLRAKSENEIEVAVGGLRLEAPSLDIGRLRLDVTGGMGRVLAERFSFDARSVRYPGPPEVDLELKAPLSIPRLEADLSQDQDAFLQVEHVVVRNLTLAASTARFVSPDGFVLAGNDASFSAPWLASDALKAEVRITGGSLRVEARDGKAQGAAGFSGFRLAVDKTPQSLAGQGKLRLENLTLQAKDRLDVGDCKERDRWKIKAGSSIRGVDIRLTLDGEQMAGTANVENVRLKIQNDGYSRCEWGENVTLWPKQEAIFDVPCGLEGFPPKVKMCRNRVTLVPEAKARIHWVAELHELHVKVRLAEAQIALRGERGVEVCPKGLYLEPPLIVANYHPNVRSSDVPVVGNLLRDLIRGTATLFESFIVSTIGTQAAITNYLHQHFFSDQCYGG
ncbi:MAG: hypothetical protein AAGC60_24620 [Acidobacteriota bacterium]